MRRSHCVIVKPSWGISRGDKVIYHIKPSGWTSKGIKFRNLPRGVVLEEIDGRVTLWEDGKYKAGFFNGMGFFEGQRYWYAPSFIEAIKNHYRPRKTFCEYETLVFNAALKMAQGKKWFRRGICMDTIKDSWEHNRSIRAAAETAYFDTQYWECS